MYAISHMAIFYVNNNTITVTIAAYLWIAFSRMFIIINRNRNIQAHFAYTFFPCSYGLLIHLYNRVDKLSGAFITEGETQCPWYRGNDSVESV